MLTYNLFRHKDEVSLYCAVPEDRPVPAFLTKNEWEYVRSLDVRTLSVFDSTAAVRSGKDNDFLFFHHDPKPVLRDKDLYALVNMQAE